MYEALTELIPALEASNFGVWKGGNRLESGFILFPYVNYSDTVHELIHRVNDFDVSKIGLTYQTYRDRLHIRGLDKDKRGADVAALDGPDVFALLLYIVRANRFGEGLLMSYLKDGTIIRWLRRLQEIDERMNAYARLILLMSWCERNMKNG